MSRTLALRRRARSASHPQQFKVVLEEGAESVQKAFGRAKSDSELKLTHEQSPQENSARDVARDIHHPTARRKLFEETPEVQHNQRGSLVQHQDNILPNNVLGEFNMVFNNNGALSLVTPKHTLGELLVQEPLAALSGAASRLGLHLKYFCNPTKVGIDFFKLQSAIKQSVGDTHPSHLQQIISAITEAGDAASQVLLAFVLGGGVAIGGAVGSNNPDNADNYQPDSTLFYGGGGGSGGDRYEPVIIVALSQANEDFLDQVRKVFAYLTVMLSAEGMHLKQYALCEGAAKNEELVAPTEAVAPVVTEAVASVGPVGVVLDFPTSMWI